MSRSPHDDSDPCGMTSPNATPCAEPTFAEKVECARKNYAAVGSKAFVTGSDIIGALWGAGLTVLDLLDFCVQSTRSASAPAATHERLDRSKAVNLARNIRETDNIEDITRRGILNLVDGVLRMDAELTRLYRAQSAKVPAWESCVRCGAAILSQHPEAEVTSSAMGPLNPEERSELERLRFLINTPQTEDYFEATRLEAAHQQERWGSEHDAGKAPEDWFWLLGYLGGKALHSFKTGDRAKGLHHIISSAAALLNWHRHATGEVTRMRVATADAAAKAMRPGIEPPSDVSPDRGNDHGA